MGNQWVGNESAKTTPHGFVPKQHFIYFMLHTPFFPCANGPLVAPFSDHLIQVTLQWGPSAHDWRHTPRASPQCKTPGPEATCCALNVQPALLTERRRSPEATRHWDGCSSPGAESHSPRERPVPHWPESELSSFRWFFGHMARCLMFALQVFISTESMDWKPSYQTSVILTSILSAQPKRCEFSAELRVYQLWATNQSINLHNHTLPSYIQPRANDIWRHGYIYIYDID